MQPSLIVILVAFFLAAPLQAEVSFVPCDNKVQPIKFKSYLCEQVRTHQYPTENLDDWRKCAEESDITTTGRYFYHVANEKVLSKLDLFFKHLGHQCRLVLKNHFTNFEVQDDGSLIEYPNIFRVGAISCE